MSKRSNDLKFGAIVEAINRNNPEHGRYLALEMDWIDQQEPENKKATEYVERLTEDTREKVDRFCILFMLIIIILLLLLQLFTPNPGSVKVV